ncbi:MAG: hypothetical protein WCP79_02225 [Bacillota bacterium]
MNLQVRRLFHRDELIDVIKMQEAVWTNDIVPLHRLLADVHSGGIILGAYEDSALLGFQYSTPAILRGRVFLWSHMTAVLPTIKGGGVGYQLKLRQRAEALADNYKLIAWTFDPLESLNANLNIGKLGAICSTYTENYYGDLDDILNSGMATDRLKVEWHISDTPLAAGGSDDALSIFVEVPSNIQELKITDKTAAIGWRLKVRQELQTAFADGWAICGFINNGKTATTHQYLLKPRNLLNAEAAPWNA